MVSLSEAAAVRTALARLLPPALSAGPAAAAARGAFSRVQVVLVPCGASPVFLPYRLLTWLKRQHAHGGLALSADGLLGRREAAAAEAAQAAAAQAASLNPADAAAAAAEAAAAAASRAEARAAANLRAAARGAAERVYLAEAVVGGRRLEAQGRRLSGGVAAAEEAPEEEVLLPRKKFDFLYYSEADNGSNDLSLSRFPFAITPLLPSRLHG